MLAGIFLYDFPFIHLEMSIGHLENRLFELLEALVHY